MLSSKLLATTKDHLIRKARLIINDTILDLKLRDDFLFYYREGYIFWFLVIKIASEDRTKYIPLVITGLGALVLIITKFWLVSITLTIVQKALFHNFYIVIIQSLVCEVRNDVICKIRE